MASRSKARWRPDSAPAIANPEGRTPPHDLDAEVAVLSAVMIDHSAMDKVVDILRPEDFYSEAHRRMFEAAVDLKSRGQPCDIVQVGTWLKQRERIQQVGGMGYITEVLNGSPAVANVRAHAETIRDACQVRQMIATCQRIAAMGYSDYGSAREYLATAASDVHKSADVAAGSKLTKIGAGVKEVAKRLAAATKSGERMTGIQTGFEQYDRMTAGLHDGDLTIVAARPGMGKTSFVLDIAKNVAAPRPVAGSYGGQCPDKPGFGVVFFSLEMPEDQLASRIACSHSRIDVSKFRFPERLVPNDWTAITNAVQYFNDSPIWVCDDTSIDLLAIRAIVRRVQSEYDRRDANGQLIQRVGLVVVDYLQLMNGIGDSPSREQEISGLSRGLKGLAKDLRVPMIALSQLNRSVETRSEKSKRPQLSDLRESGAIEQDADNVCFIYRDDYYNKNSVEKNIAELIIGKQRNGPTGTVKVRFDREYTRFDNLAPGEYSDEGHE